MTMEINYLPEGFDSHDYLELNPDVKDAGVNPEKHYLEFGIKEGRYWSYSSLIKNKENLVKGRKTILSIIVVTHNRPRLLKRALDSILLKSDEDLEIILCADDSQKSTFKIALNSLRDSDNFIRVPHMNGPAESRNMGAKIARGEWICFLDDDDTYEYSHIEYLKKLLQSTERCIHYFNYTKIVEEREKKKIKYISEDKIDISKVSPFDLLINNFIPMHSLVFPIEVFSNQLFDKYLQSHEDWDLLLSFISNGIKFKWKESPEDGVKVHIDNKGNSRNLTAKTGLDYLSIYRKWPSRSRIIQEKRASKLNDLGLTIDSKSL